jgi:ABC-type dipeptide/oligopeptide/nickel transport system permease subunit
VRGNTLVLKQQTFIESARSMGASDATILFSHILPGTVSSIVVYFTMRIGVSIISAASLSFLGLGAQPPTPEGAMLNEARADMVIAPHVAIFPSLAIFLTVLAFNLLGTGCATRWIRGLRGSAVKCAGWRLRLTRPTKEDRKIKPGYPTGHTRPRFQPSRE